VGLGLGVGVRVGLGVAVRNVLELKCNICKVGLNHIFMVHIWYSWKGNHQIYGRIHSILASPKYVMSKIVLNT
jgi:hypothetical protein